MIGHHGRPYEPVWDVKQHPLWQPITGGRDPLGEMRRIIGHALTWSGIETAPGEPLPPLPPGFTHLFAGALTLADWIGSTRGAFPLTSRADDDPDRYWLTARDRARDACARIGLVPETTPVALTGLPLLAALFPRTFGDERNVPTEMQHYASSSPLPQPGARLLIESETGSGKTEAALALYIRLRAAGLVSGLMFALPTRATASAMHERIIAALEGMYPSGPRPTVALAVGGQQPRLESNEKLMGETPNILDDLESRQSEPALESWASSHSKKYLTAEIVIGTLDQVLLGGLPIKHANLRLAALSRHLIVVDELHSFDRYMATILENLLQLHSAAGGLALFMSATLSSEARRRFGGGEELALEAAMALPFPTLATCTGPGAGWQDHALSPTGRSKTIAWSTIPEDEIVPRAAAAAAAGARVCILCNTVRRARNILIKLENTGDGDLLWRPSGSPHAPPYHSRYTLPDRLAIDAAVRERFGKHAAAEQGGVILVSTQVIEQSLDVDFDLLITDLSPVDVLLQRIGRLHRHAERDGHRPSPFRTPIALVVAPEEGFRPHLTRSALELGWGEKRPYGDYADGELTLQAMQEHPEIVIPKDNRMLVESVYHPERREALWSDEPWSDYLCKAESAKLNRTWMGDKAGLDFNLTYTANALNFSNAAKHDVRTRLGDETVRIELPEPVLCWYSQPEAPVRWVDLPTWALPAAEKGADPFLPVWAPEPDGTAAFTLEKRRYRYAPDGWNWAG
jgi:CRISPR-associated endonuclease/helicase Cas3